jgi:ankyrin repeat protein
MPDDLSPSRPYPAPVTTDLARVDQLIEYACLTFQDDDSARRRRRAERLASTAADLARESFIAAVVLGDVAAVERWLAADRELASRPGGPRGWAPLLYLCFGRVLAAGGDAVAVARLLLAAGADPKSQVLFHDRYRWTAITAAIGEGESGPVAAPPHPQARALVVLLLDAGADPNDSQALYNTHFQRDNRWLELFLSRGLGAEQAVNWTADDPTRVLDYLLGQAVEQGYLDRVALLLAHGASANGKNHYNKRPHLENALLAGHTEIAALLVRHDAAPAALSPAEAFRADCLRGDETAVRARLAQAQAHPIDDRDDVGTLLEAAEHGHLRAVRLMLDLGVSVDATNDEGATALHLAAANGHRLVVDELLARGASTLIRDRAYGGTPLGRVTWFSRRWPSPERDDARRALAARATDVFGIVYAGALDRLAKLLAEDPACANAKHPSDGRRPLHVLAEGEVPDCVPLIDLLLAHGADLRARNDKGQTPLEVATEAEADELVDLLLHRGADAPH